MNSNNKINNGREIRPLKRKLPVTTEQGPVQNDDVSNDDDSDYFDYGKPWTSERNSAKRTAVRRSLVKNIIFDEDEPPNSWPSERNPFKSSAAGKSLAKNTILDEAEDEDSDSWHPERGNPLKRPATGKSLGKTAILDEDEDSDSWSSERNPLKRLAIGNSFAKDIILDADEDPYSWSSERNPLKRSTTRKSLTKSAIDENEDSNDSIENYEKPRSTKRKVIRCFNVRKDPGKNQLIFSEAEDFSEGEYDGCMGQDDCDCPYHEDLRITKYEYLSSSDDDSLFFITE